MGVGERTEDEGKLGEEETDNEGRREGDRR